jgi:hypothetical protein
MYRVKTTYRNGTDRPITELGPWHASREDAEHWAELLRTAGYSVSIESQRIRGSEDHAGGGGGGSAGGGNDNADLAAALASMA